MKNTLVCFCLLLAVSAFSRTIDLDLRSGAALQSSAPMEKGVLRRSALAPGAALVKNLAVGDELSLRLYSDVEVKLVLVEREEAPLTGPVFQAVVDGANGIRDAVVIETPEGLLVNACDCRCGRLYSIVSSVDGVEVKEIDPNAEPSCCGGTCEPEVTGAVASHSGSVASAAPSLAASDQPTCMVDMLVAYDQPATTWANKNGGVTNLAQQCVARMNTALANNGMSTLFRFRLVGVITVSANGKGDLNSSMEAARAGTGAWAPIKAMRDTVGADIVSVMIDTGSASGTTGLGFSLVGNPPQAAYFADSAYNCISVRAAAQSHVMTHETGHNMGAGHSDMQVSAPGPQSYDYSRGHYFTGTDGVSYYTIMAYNSDGYGNYYEQAPLFSSPKRTWQGVAAGDSTHDNEQVLRNTYLAVSQFRAQKVALSYDVFFSPEPGSTFSGSMRVTLTPGKAGLAIRYTTDGSTPNASYGTVYSGPITITDATTIKAVTITDGVAGPVYEASYYPSSLGYALNAPQLTWTTSSDNPWTVQTSDTYDGAMAVKSADPFPVSRYWGENSWLKTQVTGPTKMSFRYSQRCNTPGFEVSVDGSVVWGCGVANWGEWTQVEVDIPSGNHEVKFSWGLYGSYSGSYFNGVALDTVQFDALSRPPTISPGSTADETTAKTFQGTLSVTLTPGVSGGVVRYTLDGSDPNGDNGILYTAPITLTRSTLVRAVETDVGMEPSAEVRALYLERHPLAAGEWTTDVEGAKSAAAKDGKLICVLLANLATCGWCEDFEPIMHGKTFLAWAKANGIYLVSADRSMNCDADAAYSWFWTLFRDYGDSGSAVYPTMYFAKPSAPNTAVAKGLARNDGSSTIGTVLYTGTADSLIAGVASVLSANGYTPVSVSVSVADILETTGIEWTNSSEKPWREEYPNQLRAGGLMSSTFSSVLTAKVKGKGKFVFSYKTSSYSTYNSLTFSKDGVQQWSYKYEKGTITYVGTVTNEVTSASGATFAWTCKVGAANRDYTDDYSTPCGAWIHDVQWIPEGSEGVARQDGQGNNVVIPTSWFAANGLTVADADADSDGDGICNWHEYVCGTNPKNADDVLRCTVTMVNGVPQVDYLPKSGFLSGYRAVIKSRESLDSGTWGTRQNGHRFFKVVLEK